MPGMGDRVTKGPGAVWALRPGNEPFGDITNQRSTQGIGKRATSEATREGHGGSRSVAEYRRRWGTEAQGTHGREGDVEQGFQWVRYTRETLCSPIVSPDPHWTASRAAAALLEEPYA